MLTNRKYLGEMVHKGKSYPGEHQAILDRRLWDQAQRIMADNYHVRSMKTRQKAPALLSGLLRCGHCGKAMGAGHTKRRGKGYHYYICNHAERNGYDACPVKSVAAGQVEAVVKDRIRVILASPEVIARTYRQVETQTSRQRGELLGQQERLKTRLGQLKQVIVQLAQSDGHAGAVASELEKLNGEYGQTQRSLEETEQALGALNRTGPNEDEVREALHNLDPLWNELFPAEKERIVKLLAKEVIVSRDGLLIRLRLNGLTSLVAELQGQGRAEVDGDGQTVDIHVPMEFKVRGGRKEIILPPDAHTTADVGPRSPLVLALARAYRWQRMLDSGEVASLEELAEQCDGDRSYLSRIINLACLAPNTVEAILAGREPGGLSLSRMHRNLPLCWDQQGKILCSSTS